MARRKVEPDDEIGAHLDALVSPVDRSHAGKGVPDPPDGNRFVEELQGRGVGRFQADIDIGVKGHPVEQLEDALFRTEEGVGAPEEEEPGPLHEGVLEPQGVVSRLQGALDQVGPDSQGIMLSQEKGVVVSQVSAVEPLEAGDLPGHIRP